MDTSVYDSQADNIDVDDIATNTINRIVLSGVKGNDAYDNFDELWIQNQHDDEVRYCPEGAYDMGWLGYFVGKNQHLKKLYVRPFTPTSGSSVRDVLNPFIRGVSCNKSIRELSFRNMDLLGGEVFRMLGPFFQNNYNLINIIINDCDFGDEGCRLFALAIGNCAHKSLKKVELRNSNIAEEGMISIITALSMHPHLKRLDLGRNCLRTNGCVALATLLRCSATELQRLLISNCDIGDEGIEALVPALANCSHLQSLNIYNNSSITTRGWQRFATIMESPSCNLKVLHIPRNNVDDEAVATFANVLANNHTLQTLNMNDNPITAVGWQSISKILCNTSSVNTTFQSNHTLSYLDEEVQENEIIGPLLDLNEGDDKKEVAIIKILQNHNDFDMQPFFEWEFKVLPLVLGWLERASEYDMPDDFEANIEGRKLSTIYQFVRGMPVLYVETRLRKELEDIKAEQSQMEEKFEEEQQRLLQEQQRLLQEFKQRKQYLQERKESIIKNLGVDSQITGEIVTGCK